jgi:hypothetical protein
MKANRVIRHRGSHIFYTISSQRAVRFSDLCSGRPLPPGRFLIIISVSGWVKPKTIVRLEGLGELKKSNDLIGTRTRILPTCSIVPHPTTLSRAPPYQGGCHISVFRVRFKLRVPHLQKEWGQNRTTFLYMYMYISSIVYLQVLRKNRPTLYWSSFQSTSPRMN